MDLSHIRHCQIRLDDFISVLRGRLTLRIGIIGGTGAAGKSLAVRLSSLHHEILIGSRTLEKAQEAVELLSKKEGLRGSIEGLSNLEAAKADMVFVATPWDGAQSTCAELASELTGKVVVSLANALIKVGSEMQPIILPRGSVAQSIQAELPSSFVVSALHHVPAGKLGNLDNPVEADVLVCSDHDEAKRQVIGMLEEIPGIVALDCGSLSNSGAIEAMTAVLINLNIRYKARTALRVTGLPKR